MYVYDNKELEVELELENDRRIPSQTASNAEPWFFCLFYFNVRLDNGRANATVFMWRNYNGIAYC